MIKETYKILFFCTPQKAKSNKLAFPKQWLCRDSITGLLTNEVVKEANKNPRVISLLSVAKYSAGKKCLILYVRYVNKYIYRHKVKLDYWQCLQIILNEISKYTFKFDLKGGSHHIAINESFQTSQIYLGFL